MWLSLKKAFLNSSFLWWHEGDKNKFYTLVILSLYKIPVTREPSRWPTSLKNSQSIHPPPPHPKQNFWSRQNCYDNRAQICWDWLNYGVIFQYKRYIHSYLKGCISFCFIYFFFYGSVCGESFHRPYYLIQATNRTFFTYDLNKWTEWPTNFK